jgi:general secretion pathway protein A
MYEKFFGLKRSPFALATDADLLFAGAQYREAFAGLVYAVLTRKGFVVLTGEPGTGKTSLIARLLATVPSDRMRATVIVNPILSPDDFIEYTLLNLNISPGGSKAQRLWNFERFLLQNYRDNKTTLVVLDEAHKLSASVLEEIRLLGNFEVHGQKLLQLVLAGQPELDELLGRPELWQLKQRVALRLCLHPLTAAEIDEYIRYRWSKAGGGRLPFETAALRYIARWSGGIPRLVNSICDNALAAAYGADSEVVTPNHVLEAVRDLDLPASGLGSAATSYGLYKIRTNDAST